MFCVKNNKRISSALRGGLCLCLSGVGFIASPFLQAEDSAYKKPDLKEKIFDSAKIELASERKAEIVNALTAVAVAKNTETLVRAKAIGIALRLDSIAKRAFVANEMLAKGKNPDPFPSSWGDMKAMADRLWRLADELKLADGADKDNFIVASYLMSIYTAMEPDDLDRKYELAVFSKEKDVEMDWVSIIGDAEEGEAGGKKMTPGIVESDREGSPLKLARLQTKVKGLLVQQLEANTFAGKASQMNATAEASGSSKEMSVAFDQGVGEDMRTALKKVVKYLRLQHKSLPAGYRVEISFEEQYIPKDGPSAAVACALLLNSLIEGDDIDPDIAVTGDMNADGTVQPVGGITGKLRGAVRRDCSVIGIPEPNKRVINDLLIVEGPLSLSRIQIFTLGKFEDAWKLAASHDKRNAEIKESIEVFGEVQKVLNRSGGIKYLRNSHVRERLKKCLELTPNHLSAQLLLDASMGRVPKKLSLLGSVENIDRTAEPLLRAIRQKKFDISDPLAGDEYADAASAIKRIRPMLDDRTLKCADALVNYSLLMRRYATARPKSYNGVRKLVAEIQGAGSVINQEYDTLYSRVDVKEEIMR